MNCDYFFTYGVIKSVRAGFVIKSDTPITSRDKPIMNIVKHNVLLMRYFFPILMLLIIIKRAVKISIGDIINRNIKCNCIKVTKSPHYCICPLKEHTPWKDIQNSVVALILENCIVAVFPLLILVVA